MTEEGKLSDPERIWLIHDAEAEEPITWSNRPNPYAEYGEEPDRSVEYIRADLARTPLEKKNDDC